MANRSGQKGTRRERQLVNALAERGWAIVRSPASGSATDREQPDLLVGNGDEQYGIEAKASGGDPIYLDGKEVDDLEYFCHSFGAKARIAVKFDVKHGDPAYGDDDNPGWYFIHPIDLHQTDGGNFRIKKGRALEIGLTIDEL